MTNETIAIPDPVLRALGPDPTIQALLNAASHAKYANFFLDDLIKALPEGTTREVVCLASRRLYEAETALGHEADVLLTWLALEP